MAFTLRQETHAGFTTATGALTYLQGDNNFIGLYERDDLKLALTGGTLTGALTVSTGNFNVASGQILSGGTELSTLWGGGGGGATDLDGLTDVKVFDSSDGAASDRYNAFISNGPNSGAACVTGTLSGTHRYNYAFGANALNSLTSGNGNVGIGYNALTGINSGGSNVAIGVSAGESLTTQGNNVILGYNCGYGNTGGQNILIGVSVAKTSSASYNTCVGNNAGTVLAAGSHNAFFGTGAGSAITSGSNNVIIGRDSGGLITGGNQIVIGESIATTTAGTLALGKYNSILLHGDFATSAQNKLGINLGNTYQAPTATLHVKGGGATSGTLALLVESSSPKPLVKIYDSGNVIKIGANAGHGGGTVAQICIGDVAGFYPTGGSNTAIGNGALYGTSAGNTNGCVAIGDNALSSVIDARRNVAIGKNAGDAVEGGDDNTLLGYYAGDNITEGDFNIIIGSGIDAATATGDYQLNIGGNITGSMAATDRYTKFVGQTYGDLYTQADGVTITPDFKNGNTQTVELGGNRAIANPTNIKVGATYLIIIKQDATGSRTVTWGSNYKFPGGTAPTLTTTADQADVITMIAYNASILMCTSTLDFATS